MTIAGETASPLPLLLSVVVMSAGDMHRLSWPVFPSTCCLLPSYKVLGRGGACLKDDRLDEIIISSNLDPHPQKERSVPK